MAESAERRNRRAQAELARRGLDPGPERGAFYRLRRLRGEERGLTGAQAVGKPRKGETLTSRLVARGEVVPAERRRGRRIERAPRVVEVPTASGQGARIVTSTSHDFLRRQLRKASRDGADVSLRITADKGYGPREHAVTGSPDTIGIMRGRLDGNDEAGGLGASREGARRVGKVQMVVSSDPAVMGGQGFDPDFLLDFLDLYDDWDDAFADLWDWDY
jgi:hypothetical protein